MPELVNKKFQLTDREKMIMDLLDQVITKREKFGISAAQFMNGPTVSIICAQIDHEKHPQGLSMPLVLILTEEMLNLLKPLMADGTQGEMIDEPLLIDLETQKGVRVD